MSFKPNPDIDPKKFIEKMLENKTDDLFDAKKQACEFHNYEELDQEIRLMDGYAGLPLDEILVVISSPKPIDREWRVVVDAELGGLASSLYKENGKLTIKEGCPQEVLDVANKIAEEKWQPDRIYTVDVCESNGEFYFLEANSFSCSGLYGCDVKPIVDVASKIAMKEWEEYQE